MDRPIDDFVIPVAGRSTDMMWGEVLESINLPPHLEHERPAITADVSHYVNTVFAGHTPQPASKYATAIHMHGAPGSGKTFAATGASPKNLPLLGYDINGAMESFSTWKRLSGKFEASSYQMRLFDEPESPLASYKRLLALRDDLRDASQVAYGLALNVAVLKRYSFINDVTSSNPSIMTLMDEAADKDFNNYIHSYFACFDISEQRIIERAIPISHEELVCKRVGAFLMLPELVASIAEHEHERMSGFYNPNNTAAPVLAYKIANGEVIEIYPDVISAIQHDMLDDTTHPSLRGNAEILQATEVAYETLENIKNGKAPAPMPSGPIEPHT